MLGSRYRAQCAAGAEIHQREKLVPGEEPMKEYAGFTTGNDTHR